MAKTKTEEAPPISRTTRCPLCKRPRDNPDLHTPTDRLLAISPNPLIAYMRLHDYAGPGAIPPIAERFLRYLDRDPHRSTAQLARAVEILTEFCQGRRRLATVVIAVVLEGISYRDLAAELGITDHTVATIAQHGKLILDALCREAGVYTMIEP